MCRRWASIVLQGTQLWIDRQRKRSDVIAVYAIGKPGTGIAAADEIEAGGIEFTVPGVLDYEVAALQV